MGMRTFLGTMLNGTVKNNNANVVTSSTPSAAFLDTAPGSIISNTGGYRNTGPGDAYQFISIAQTTFTSIAAASFPYTLIPTYTVGGVVYPIVIPAGSYIDNINIDLTTAFTFSGSPTGFTAALQLIGAPGGTYATAQTIATMGTSSSNVLTQIGRYTVGNSGSSIAATNIAAYTTSATPLAMVSNTGTTDTMLQLLLTFNAGTTPAITAGAVTIAIDYAIRNYDGTWYPQTPPGAPQTTYPVTY